MNGHELYETGDLDVPDQILDRNGEVVLGLCKHCGKAEIELEEPCSKPNIGVLEWPKLTGAKGPTFHERKAKRDQDLVVEKAARLAKKLSEVVESPEFMGLFVELFVRGREYTGPQFGIELSELQAALKKIGALNDEVVFDDRKPVMVYEPEKMDWDFDEPKDKS